MNLTDTLLSNSSDEKVTKVTPKEERSKGFKFGQDSIVKRYLPSKKSGTFGAALLLISGAVVLLYKKYSSD